MFRIIWLIVLLLIAMPLLVFLVLISSAFSSSSSQDNNTVLQQAQKALEANQNQASSSPGIQAPNDSSQVVSKITKGSMVENQNDLVFNVQGLSTSPVTKHFQINGQAWHEICPSNQCQIEENEYSLYVVTPSRDEDSPRVYLMLLFDVHDNITNKDLTPLQKKFVESYRLSFSCSVNSVNDIIEQGNNVIYKCSGSPYLGKEHKEKTDATYHFKVEGTYDNQSDTLTATGQYEYKS